MFTTFGKVTIGPFANQFRIKITRNQRASDFLNTLTSKVTEKTLGTFKGVEVLPIRACVLNKDNGDDGGCCCCFFLRQS